LFKTCVFLIINAAKGIDLPLSLAFSDIIERMEVFFILYIEYESKPKLFSKNSFIFTNKGSCVLDNLIESTGLKAALSILNEPSPSIKPTNQLFVIKTWFSGILKLIRLVFMLFFNSNNLDINSSVNFSLF
ncbi:hypothetical protein COCC4DRAFT_154330, partial [Bipolaris maydis ATCC 48331]